MGEQEDEEWDCEPTEQDRYNMFRARPKFGLGARTKETELLREELELAQAKDLKTKTMKGSTESTSRVVLATTQAPKRASKVFASVVSRLKKGGQRILHKSEEEVVLEEITDEEVKAYFDEVRNDTFSEQAVKFLNAYWAQVGDQADFIYDVALKWFVYADMHTKGISNHSTYKEDKDLDYMTTLYFYEKLYYFLNNTEAGKYYSEDPKYEPSMVQMKTAIQRKRELQSKVDVNFDGRISFIEHLLYQYNCEEINVKDYVRRSRTGGREHPSIIKARKALHEVSDRISKYQEKKEELEKRALSQSGSMILKRRAQFELSCLKAGPLAESLQAALISAEAKVRRAVKKFSRSSAGSGGSIFWIQKDLEARRETVEEIKNTSAA